MSSKAKTGPKRIHEDTWTFRCPCSGKPRTNTNTDTPVLSTPEFLGRLAGNCLTAVMPKPKSKQKSQPSMKVGCPARFTIKKRIDNGLYELDWFWQHLNHEPYSVADMKRMRLASPVRKWLSERVLAGMTWPAIKKLLMSPDLFSVGSPIWILAPS
ncbi:hypothetical protein DFH28DRAFT_933891 [Melampsora americana]|nr:hypothetical protein DFH28DRAFT_933891 [Melampsora americana]